MAGPARTGKRRHAVPGRVKKTGNYRVAQMLISARSSHIGGGSARFALQFFQAMKLIQRIFRSKEQSAPPRLVADNEQRRNIPVSPTVNGDCGR